MYQRLILACIVLFLASGPLVAGKSGVYKWVDDSGKVHYSGKSPAGREAEKIKIAPPPVVDPVDDGHDSPAARPVEERPAGENDGAATGISEAENDKLIKENCATARRNHAAFQQGRNKAYMSPDGKVVQLTEVVRLQRISESKQQIKKYCDS